MHPIQSVRQIAAGLPLEQVLYRPRIRRLIVDPFHRLFYGAGRRQDAWADMRWLGTPALKCPFDLWVYQEILFETRPALIVETGTAFGGSALYLASLCDLLGEGQVVSIDIESREGRPAHDRLAYLTGSSTSPEIHAQVQERVAGADGGAILVILDSDHRKQHVQEELELYSPIVTVGSYVIVEDTNVNGHPVSRGFGPGPMEAVDGFLARDRGFVIDRRREKFFLTFNPRGYLRRVS